MIVTCKNVLSQNSTSKSLGDGWITPGKKYDVLGIYGRSSNVSYRLIGDDGFTPALHSEINFEIVEPGIPQGWVFKLHASSEWELTPALWAEDGFWESYFNGEDPTVEAFWNVVNALKGKGRIR